MLARDVSNFTVPLVPALIQSWKAEGVGLVLCQAFPPSYHQYAEQRDQMRVCRLVGMPFDCYVYDYLGSPDWLSGALDGIDQAGEADIRPRKVWLDEEDVETEAGWSPQQRTLAISNSLGSVTQRGYARGIYSAAWWWTPKIGGFLGFSTEPLWAAQYDGVADASVFTPFGGWTECRIKQYAGSQPDGTDLNVLSLAEEEELMGTDFPDVPPNPIPSDCDGYRAAIERGVNRLQIELDRKTAAGKPATLRRTLIREISAELFSALSS